MLNMQRLKILTLYLQNIIIYKITRSLTMAALKQENK